MFYKGIERLAGSLSGIFTILQDNVYMTALSFGEILAPTVREVMIDLTQFIKRIRQLDPSVKENIISMTAFAISIGPALIAIGLLTTAIGKLLLLKAALAAFGISLATALGPLIIIAGLAGIFVVLDKLVKYNQKMREKAQTELETKYPKRMKARWGEVKPVFGPSIPSVAQKYGGYSGYYGMPTKGPGESYGPYPESQFVPKYGRMPTAMAPYTMYPETPEVDVNVNVSLDDGLIGTIKEIKKKNINKVKATTDSSLGGYLRGYSPRYGRP